MSEAIRAGRPVTGTPGILDRGLVVALVWMAAAFLIYELAELDIWWHMAIGEDILRHLRVPDTNPYSAGALGKPYHDSHWLFQLAIALGHRLAGLSGPHLVMIAVWGSTLYMLHRETRAQVETGPAVLLTFLAVAASTERFLPRPEIVSFCMIVAFYSLLRRGRYETPPQLALLTLLQVVWVNSHGLFVIGPFMVGCYWFEHALHRARGKENRLKPLSILLALVAAAMLVSPHGTGAVAYAYLLFTEVGHKAPEHMQRVTELSPTFGAASRSGSAFWFYAALLALAALAVATNFRRLVLSRLLIVVALGLASFTGRRNIVLFAIVAAPFIAENLGPLLSRLKIGAVRANAMKGALVAVLLLWSAYPLSGRYYLDIELPARFGVGVTPDFFPHGVIPFIREHGIQGQVYNSNRLGGFYLYHFYPDRIPLIDGRWEVYGDEFFAQRKAALSSYAAWKQWATGANITSVLLLHTDPESRLLVPSLYRDPEWSLVYYDFAGVLFVRNDHRGSAQSIVFTDDTPLLEGDVRLDSRLILNALYYNLGLKRLLLANLERIAVLGSQAYDLERARLYAEFGRAGEGEALLGKIVERQPRHTEALSDLALIHYQRGQYERALAYMTQAATAAPGDVDLAFNQAVVLRALKRDAEAAAVLRRILASRPDYAKARQLMGAMGR